MARLDAFTTDSIDMSSHAIECTKRILRRDFPGVSLRKSNDAEKNDVEKGLWL